MRTWLAVALLAVSACKASHGATAPHPGQTGSGGDDGTGGSAGSGGDGTACTESATRPCELNTLCGPGMQTCTSGTWSACTFVKKPDICNGLDDDCDGLVDNGAMNSCGGSCELGAAAGDACGSVDPCKRGTFACQGLNALTCQPLGGGEVKWVWSVGGPKQDEMLRIASTGDGGAVVLSTYTEAIDFGGGIAVAGGPGAFVARISSDGKTVWARRIKYGQLGAVAVETSGKILLLLWANQDTIAEYGPLAVEGVEKSFTLSDPGVFLVRMSPDGEPLTMEALTGPASSDLDVQPASDGGVIVGLWGQGIALLTGNLNGTTVGTDWGSMITLKLDADLHGVWVREINGRPRSTSPHVADDGLGAVYATATMSGPATVSPGHADATSVDTGDSTLILASFGSNGALSWTQELSGNWTTGGVHGDSGGGTYLSAVRAPSGIGNHASAERRDAHGNLIWTNSIDALQVGDPWVLPTGDGGAYFGASTQGVVVVGRDDPQQTVLSSDDAYAPVLARLGPDGKVVWAQIATVDAAGNSIVDAALTTDGGVLVAGTVGTDALQLGRCGQSVPVPHTDQDDVFVAKFGR